MPQAAPPFHFALLGPRHWPAWFGLGCIWLVARLPHAWLMRIGRSLGWLAARSMPGRREVAARNLALCFPEQSPAQRAALLAQNFHDAGAMLAEFVLAWMGSARAIENIPVSFECLEYLEAARV